MNRPIRLVIFDLDGTLMDAYKAVSRSINFTLKKFGLKAVDHATIKKTVGWGDRHLLASLGGEERSYQMLAVYRRHHAQSLTQDTKFLPGAKKLIKDLRKQGYLLAIASNRPTRFSHIALRHLKIKDHFDYILCGDKATRPKPYPDMLLQILKKLRLQAKQALYVGDMTIDVKTGKRAKILTIAIPSGSSNRKDLARLKPYRIIDRVDQVAQIVQKLNA